MNLSYLKLEDQTTVVLGEQDPLDALELEDLEGVTICVINFDPNQLNFKLPKDQTAISPMKYLTGLLELSRFQGLFDLVIINRIDLGICLSDNTKKGIGAVLKQVFDRAKKGASLLITTCTSQHAITSRAHRTIYIKK